MLISKKNIKIQNNTFIDSIYTIYSTLHHNKAFTEKGYESDGFKTWRRDDEYYILDKSSGVLVTWHKLLGWNLESNDVLKDEDWRRFCERLKNDIEQHNMTFIDPTQIKEET
jgi:hypothetical protein